MGSPGMRDRKPRGPREGGRPGLPVRPLRASWTGIAPGTRPPWSTTAQTNAKADKPGSRPGRRQVGQARSLAA